MIDRLRRLSCIPLVLLACACAGSPSDGRPARGPSIERAIERLVAEADPATELAVAIAPLRGPSGGDPQGVRFARHERMLMRPASALKLLTAAAAIDAGLLDARVVTRLLRDRDGTALLLEGGGDPLLEVRDLSALIAEANAAGVVVDEVVLVDSTRFAAPPFGAGWMWDDEPSAYMPWISALTVDGGAVGVRVGLGHETEAVPLVAFDPPAPRHFVLDATLAPAPIGSPSTVTIAREVLENRRVVRVRGEIARGSVVEATFSVPDPDLFAAEVFIALAGRDAGSRVGRLHPDDRSRFVEVARVEHGFEDILTRMLKRSDNLAAECVLRHLALQADPATPATAERGVEVVGRYVTRLGFDAAAVHIADGSGLSFYNAIPAALLVAALSDMANRDSYARFRAMLPVAGVDGTLERRFTETPARGRIAAKTGTLTGTSALAGYADGPDGTTHAFAILAGDYAGDAGPWRERIDAIVTQLVQP